MRLFALAPLALTLALPATASAPPHGAPDFTGVDLSGTIPGSPEAAAILGRALGRPVTSFRNLEDLAAQYDLKARPTRMFAPGGAPLGIYLNRFATHYECGDDDASRNISSVVCGSSSSTVGGFSGSTSQWNSVVDCVSDLFAPFNVYVTDIEPQDGEYVEAMVGGEPGDAGMDDFVGGVAPFTCGMIPSGVVYAFADIYGNDMQGICETVGQEVAHAFGLDHELLCEDPMTYLGGCGSKSFQDEYASCGEYEPRECSCGIPSQNSVQMMLERLGAADGSEPPPPPDDNEDPVIELLSPDDGAGLVSNSTISVSARVTDDTAFSIVELEWDFTGESMFCPGNGGAWQCDIDADDVATWTIQVGEGARTFRVHVRDIVGNEVTSEDRTVFLTADGGPPPEDPTPPTVIVLSPRNNAVLPAQADIQIVAVVADDQGLSKVELEWPYRDEAYPCPLNTDGVSCSVDGDVHTWTLRVGEGVRDFTVHAVDVGGNSVRSESFHLYLENGAEVPPDDGNTTPDHAVPVACGDEIALDGVDADWVEVDAPEGQQVSVTVDGAGASVVATRSGTQVADGDGSVEFEAAGGKTQVAVLPDEASGGGYTVKVVCEDAASGGARKAKGRDADGGLANCAQGPGAAPWAAVLALALVRRRRRA